MWEIKAIFIHVRVRERVLAPTCMYDKQLNLDSDTPTQL